MHADIKKYNTQINIDNVSRRFAHILAVWFRTNGMLSDDGAERVPCKRITEELVLNANDHFDANMAMHEAIVRCGIISADESPIESEDFCALFDGAWAEAAEFVKQRGA